MKKPNIQQNHSKIKSIQMISGNISPFVMSIQKTQVCTNNTQWKA